MSKKAKPVIAVRKKNKNTRVGKNNSSSSSTKESPAESSVGELEQVAETLRGKKRDKRGGGGGGGGSQQVLPSSSNPMKVGRLFLSESGLLTDGEPTIKHWRSGWWFWKGPCWEEHDDHAIRALLYRFTEHAVVITPLDVEPWMPNRRKITDLADALRAIAVLPPQVDQPSWLDGRNSGKIIVATANGLLDIERGQLYPHNPRYFNSTAVPFDYQPEAPKPVQWLAFLDKLWPRADDKTRPEIDALGEWFGYVAGSTDQRNTLVF